MVLSVQWISGEEMDVFSSFLFTLIKVREGVTIVTSKHLYTLLLYEAKDENIMNLFTRHHLIIITRYLHIFTGHFHT